MCIALHNMSSEVKTKAVSEDIQSSVTKPFVSLVEVKDHGLKNIVDKRKNLDVDGSKGKEESTLPPFVFDRTFSIGL